MVLRHMGGRSGRARSMGYVGARYGLAPPTQQLVNSLSAILAVFHAIIDARVRQGDEFIRRVTAASSGDAGALKAALGAAPAPALKGARVFDMRDYQSQFVAALVPSSRTAFCGGAIPEFPLSDYISRFFSYCPVNDMSNAVYLIALILLDRALSHTPSLFLTSWNAHRLVLGAFVFAAKMHEDECTLQEHFSKHGGVSLPELNAIEAAFFKAIDYRGFVHHDDFAELQHQLVKEALGNLDKRAIVYDTLRSERVAAVDIALAQVLSAPPRSEGAIHTAMRAAGAAGAFAQVLFPDLQVDPPSSEQELTSFLRCAADYTPEQLHKFRLFRDIVRSPMRYFAYVQTPANYAASPAPYAAHSSPLDTRVSPAGVVDPPQWDLQSGFSMGTDVSSSVGSHLDDNQWASPAAFPAAPYTTLPPSGSGARRASMAYGSIAEVARLEHRSLDASFVSNSGGARATKSDAALIDAIGNAWGRKPGMPDLASSIAKSAVAYILNDDDPFQDLQRVPVAAAHARKLGRTAVRNGLVFGQ